MFRSRSKSVAFSLLAMLGLSPFTGRRSVPLRHRRSANVQQVKMIQADLKRLRKNEKRRAVHFQQLGQLGNCHAR